jgi:carbon storage regulator CsrA
MLVLTRKVGESVVLPDCGVTVTVVAIQGDRVRLGFRAPDSVTVHREEVWQRLAAPTAPTPALGE